MEKMEEKMRLENWELDFLSNPSDCGIEMKLAMFLLLELLER